MVPFFWLQINKFLLEKHALHAGTLSFGISDARLDVTMDTLFL